MPAIAVHHTEAMKGTWDAGANVKRLKDDAGAAVFRRMFAWMDPDGDPNTKDAYKFPHHEVSGDGSPGAANMTACSTAMAALNGGRGGAKIPAGDRAAVHRHIAAHMMDADMEPPELKSALDAEEFRSFAIEELEIREDGQPLIGGYAAVFNQLSEPIMGFRELIEPGAFRKTLREADIRALMNHDPNYVLARNKAGTLRLKEDRQGLAIEIDPPDTQWARDLMVSMRRGDINQMSFQFRTIKDKWTGDANEPVRRLQEVRLADVSIVTFPAYPQTSAQVRSLLQMIGGLDLADADEAEVRQAIEMLQSCLRSEPGHHSEDRDAEPPQAGHSRAAYRRELDLMALTL